MAQIQILTAQAAGNGASFPVVSPAHVYKSHLRTYFVWGTFDTTTGKLQISMDETTWFDVVNSDVTVQSVLNLEFRALFMRGVVSGGAGSSINMIVY